MRRRGTPRLLHAKPGGEPRAVTDGRGPAEGERLALRPGLLAAVGGAVEVVG